MQHYSDESAIRRYLLGNCTDSERQKIEQQMMTDGNFVERVTLLEEELVDEYVRGTLPAVERDPFEHHFLSTPEGVEQLRLAALLNQYAAGVAGGTRAVDPAAPRRSLLDYLRAKFPVPGYAFAITAAILVSIAVGGLISRSRLQNQFDELLTQQSSSDQALREQLSEQQANNRELREQIKLEQDKSLDLEQKLNAITTSNEPDQPQEKTLAIALSPGRVRSEGPDNRLIIKPGTAKISFHLTLRNSDYTDYKVSLRNEAGEELWASNGQKTQGRNGRKEVRVILPASLLASGGYFLRLQAVVSQDNYENAGNYYFQAVRR